LERDEAIPDLASFSFVLMLFVHEKAAEVKIRTFLCPVSLGELVIRHHPHLKGKEIGSGMKQVQYEVKLDFILLFCF
jgi:hypothetical protein